MFLSACGGGLGAVRLLQFLMTQELQSRKVTQITAKARELNLGYLRLFAVLRVYLRLQDKRLD